MMTNNIWKVSLLAAMCGASVMGCDAEDEGPIDFHGDDDIDFTPVDEEISFRATLDNGVENNGFEFNGFRFNGFRFNTFILGLVEQTASITQLQFQSGSLLKGWHPGTSSWKVGAQLNGMTFDIDVEIDGTPATGQIRIVSVTQSATHADVYFYRVETYKNGAWQSTCFDGGGNPTEAIALEGNWDTVTGARTSDVGLTWACRGAALAKAVEWGYRPWVSTTHKNLHQAASRMIRADYCGNGQHHTTNGNPIDIQDHLGIQTFDSSWNIEAGWGVNGAICLDTPRKLYYPKNTLNPCSNLPACSTNPIANQGALLATKVVPNSN